MDEHYGRSQKPLTTILYDCIYKILEQRKIDILNSGFLGEQGAALSFRSIPGGASKDGVCTHKQGLLTTQITVRMKSSRTC